LSKLPVIKTIGEKPIPNSLCDLEISCQKSKEITNAWDLI